MLVLSRKVGERILIGDQIAVTIVRVTGGGVRVGIEAPPELAVLRAEIKNALENGSSNGDSANPPPSSVNSASDTRSSTTIKPTVTEAVDDPSSEVPPVRKPR